MEKTELQGISQIFKESGYSIADQLHTRIIEKRGSGGIIGFIISLFIGLVLLSYGLFYGLHYTTVISGFFFVGFPFLYDRWKYPRKIIIDHENDSLDLISGVTYRRSYRLSDISGLNVDENVLSSDTSPFKEGYRDFIYSFGLNVANSEIKFIKLLYRKESDSKIEEIFNFLTHQLKITKAG